MRGYCFVVEIGYPNGEAERATHSSLRSAVDSMDDHSDKVDYCLISRIPCIYHNDGLKYVEPLGKPFSIRFRDGGNAAVEPWQHYPGCCEPGAGDPKY